jgi:hypothetical protein
MFYNSRGSPKNYVSSSEGPMGWFFEKRGGIWPIPWNYYEAKLYRSYDQKQITVICTILILNLYS